MNQLGGGGEGGTHTLRQTGMFCKMGHFFFKKSLDMGQNFSLKKSLAMGLFFKIFHGLHSEPQTFGKIGVFLWQNP